MKLAEKQELVRLLHLYQDELIQANEANIRESQKHPEKKLPGSYKLGVKAQFEHARIIATKLSVEIGREMKAYWDL